MGRRPGSKNKPKLATVGPGHNRSVEQLNDDQMQALTRQHAARRAKLIESEKKAKADRMNFDKVIKADLGPKGLANIKLLEDLETPEGEARVKAEIERQAMVARWAGLAIGTQGSLFDDDRRPLEERAYLDGKRSGLKGETLNPPHQPGTEGYQPYVEGWHAGQALNASPIKAPADAEAGPKTELLREEGGGKPAADEFDAAADASSPGKPWPDDVQAAKAAQESAAAQA